MYRLLWHLSTWIVLLLLYRAYLDRLKKTASAKISSPEEKRRYALCAGLLLLPLVGAVLIALMRYAKELSSVTTVPEFLRLSAAVYLVVLSVLLVAIGAALKMKRPSTD